MEVKKGVSFTESSPVLNNISGAASWEKVTGVPYFIYLGDDKDVQSRGFGQAPCNKTPILRDDHTLLIVLRLCI